MTSEDSPIAPTITPAEIAGRRWDVIVIGAGPAGAFAALHLARIGASVLLVDRSHFPRQKVCGCCVNALALRQLEHAGLGYLPRRLGGRPLTEVQIRCGNHSARLPLRGSISLSRRALDAALIRAAVEAGAALFTGAAARIGPAGDDHREVRIGAADDVPVARARVVIAADGLAGRSLDDIPGMQKLRLNDARIGLGAISQAASPRFREGSIYMACSARGYAGLVRLETGDLDVAAAVDPPLVRAMGGPGDAVAFILRDAGFEPPADLLALDWHGTPALTTHRRDIAGERLLVIGDAAGYVEPFTGEGIAWALLSATAVAPIAARGARRWTPDVSREWTHTYRTLLEPRHRSCRYVAWVLRHPRATRLAVRALALRPQLAQPVLSHMTAPPRDTLLPTASSRAPS